MSSRAALEIALELVDRATAPLKRSMGEVERSVVSLDRRMERVSSTVRALGAAFGGWQLMRLAGEVISLTDKYTLLEGRLGLVTTSSAQLADVQEKLYRQALQTHSEYEATVTMYTRFARATQDLGTSQEDMLTITRAVNEAIMVSGATSEEARGAIIQLSQGMASGVLRGQELNSVLDQTPRIARMIADGLGISIGELRKWGQQGKLTTEAVIGALKSQAATVHDEFARMQVTVGKAWGDLQTVLAGIVNDGGQSVSITETLSGEIEDFASYLDEHRDDIRAFFVGGVEGARRFGEEALPVIEDLWHGLEKVIDGYNSLDPVVKDVGIVLAIVGGKKGMAALAAVSAAAAGGHALSDALLKVLGIQKQQVAETGGLAGLWERYDHWVGRTVQSLKEWYAGSPRLQEFTGVFVDQEKAVRDTAAAVSDLGQDVDALVSYYEAAGDAAEKSGKKQVQAIHKVVKYTHQQLQEWQIQGKLIGRDMWLSYAEGAEEAGKRAEAAIKDRNDAITADLEDMMKENDDLWGFEAEQVSQVQQEMVNDLGRIMDGYIYDILPVDLSAIKDQFGGLFASIVDMFMRMVSQMAANSLVEAIFGKGSSGGPTLSSLGGIASSISSALGGPSIGSLASSAASSLGIVGGAATIAPYAAGGTYATLGGGVAAGGTGAVGGMATFGLPQEGSIAGGAAAAPTTAGGGATGAGIATAGAYAAIAAIAGRIAVGVLHAGDHAMPSSALTMLSPVASNFRGYADENILGKIHDDTTALSSAIDGMFANMIEGANNLADGWGDHIRELTDELSRNFDSGGVDRFLDAISGIDISATDAANALDLANQAAAGNAGAMDQLTSALVGMGMSTETASAATAALMEAERQHGNVVNETLGSWRRSINQLSSTHLDLNAKATLDVEVRGAAKDHTSVSSSISSHSSTWNHGFGSEDDGWGDYHGSGNSWQWWQPHASGGVFERPVALGNHLFGEAGPEILAPLPGGANAFAEMAREVKMLARGQGNQPMTIILQTSIAGRRLQDVVLPMVDRHIASRETRGVSGRVIYAAG